jgi:methylated-DNA-protein-cysteine methyltransferase-like protein
VRALYRSIYAVIRRVPTGHVATYGQIAELAGIPGGARVAGASLKVSKPSDALPWQRIVGKASKLRARIAIHDPVGAAIQRNLLEDEGVAIGETGLIDLGVYGWLPADATKRVSVPRRPATVGSGRAASPRRPPRSGSKRRASSSRR